MTLLTTDDFRAFEATTLDDGPLQVLLDAAEAEIVRFAGDPASAVEWLVGGQRFLYLRRPASSITSIVETTISTGDATTLATDDWLLWPGGSRVERLNTGTNTRWNWWGRVAVTYVPTDDTALRKSVQAALIKLEINTRFGLSQQTIGTWSESYQQSAGSAAVQHELILSRLSPGPSLVVVG